MASDRGARSSWFPVVIYEHHYQQVKSALETIGYKYAMIAHDKDLDEQGNVKKKHWHIVLLCEKREFQYTIANRLQIERNLVQYPLASEPNGAIRYLTHIDNPEKAQYKREDIETNILSVELDKLHQKVAKKSKDEENEELLEDIERLSSYKMSYKAFLLAHPAFIYQVSSLVKLVQISKDVQWNNVVDCDTGEYVCQS